MPLKDFYDLSKLMDRNVRYPLDTVLAQRYFVWLNLKFTRKCTLRHTKKPFQKLKKCQVVWSLTTSTFSQLQLLKIVQEKSKDIRFSAQKTKSQQNYPSIIILESEPPIGNGDKSSNCTETQILSFRFFSRSTSALKV